MSLSVSVTGWLVNGLICHLTGRNLRKFTYTQAACHVLQASCLLLYCRLPGNQHGVCSLVLLRVNFFSSLLLHLLDLFLFSEYVDRLELLALSVLCCSCMLIALTECACLSGLPFVLPLRGEVLKLSVSFCSSLSLRLTFSSGNGADVLPDIDLSFVSLKFQSDRSVTSASLISIRGVSGWAALASGAVGLCKI